MLRNFILLLICITCTTGCKIFINTITVEVPDGYEGWCFVIPAEDTTGLGIKMSPPGIYKMNTDGVAYVPASLMKPEDDVRLNIFQSVREISENVRYKNRVVSSNSTSETKHHYLIFLIPDEKSRKISESDPYWRDNSLLQEGSDRFQYLLNSYRIVYQ